MSGRDTLPSDLELAQRGDAAALDRLLESLRTYLQLMAEGELDPELRQKVGASDLVQDTLIEAQRDFAQFSGRSTAEFKAWLRQILRNNALNLHRRFQHTQKRNGHEVPLTTDDSRSVAHELADRSATPQAKAISRELNELVDAHVARLPSKDQEVIRLWFAEGLSFVEIGARIGASDDAVRKRFVRAIEKLGEAFAEDSQ
jgi:RNA polymerase sigma-70 factor (ECF subfamily)